MASKSKPALSWTPMVSDPTRSQSESIQTVYSRLKKGRLVIPDYQREADQWDDRKESLFLESILNNLTIPAFFFAETDANIEVVDGQQRLNTIAKFIRGETAINDELTPNCQLTPNCPPGGSALLMLETGADFLLVISIRFYRGSGQICCKIRIRKSLRLG